MSRMITIGGVRYRLEDAPKEKAVPKRANKAKRPAQNKVKGAADDNAGNAGQRKRAAGAAKRS